MPSFQTDPSNPELSEHDSKNTTSTESKPSSRPPETQRSLRAKSDDPWRIFRILSDFVEGMERLSLLGPAVTVIGSARLCAESPYYSMAAQAAEKLGKKGFSIITGGGPGIMEAANYGAHASGGGSCGLSIDLPFEETFNPYVDRELAMKFRYFFTRKVLMVRYAQAIIAYPGGLGTLDELFEALTLLQTGKCHAFPIFLVGKEYWSPLEEWMGKSLLPMGCIDGSDLKLFEITDDIDYICEEIQAHWQTNGFKSNF